MKMLILFSLFLSFNALAEVYEQTSEWNGDDPFSVIEVQGIKMNAIDLALNNCRVQGNTYCILRSTENQTHNRIQYSTKYERNRRYTRVGAVVQSLSGKLSHGQVYEASNSWNFDTDVSTLQSEGVKIEALEDALAQCYRAGNQFCAILNTSLEVNNSPSYDSSFERMRRKTTAKASVQALNMK